MSDEDVEGRLQRWFPWAKWSARMAGGYCCVCATFDLGRVGIAGFVFDRVTKTERVARARSWSNALQQAKRWAWKQMEPKP